VSLHCRLAGDDDGVTDELNAMVQQQSSLHAAVARLDLQKRQLLQQQQLRPDLLQ
jgi:hypothetical protein